ncbi:dimethylaniline monooxygenase 2 [Apiospora rasikravindrae]|uniref:Dimethylaniline monooxygenase 2 n=1 Tax=Apiospora rasikravindrae TaxID=990691 RepID=A0ABR1S3C2_9PEZI
MDKVNIAVIGTGPAGLTALKTLREEGFNATAFERRDRIGGLWSHSGNPAFTSIVNGTVCNISKFVSGFSDFPLPRDSPVYLSGEQVSDYFHSYATHFKLLEHVRFGNTVRKVLRNSADDGWDVHVTDADGDRILPFHKVVFGSGNESIPSWPRLPGRDKFKGILIHGQAYKSPERFIGKRVLVVGMGNTGSDIATALCNSSRGGAPTKVYHSYRRGRLMISRYEADGTPLDTKLSWPTMCLKYLLDAWAPRLIAPLIDRAMLLRHEWRLADFPSMSRRHPAVNEYWFPAVQTGTITPVHGLKGFVSDSEVLLDDDTVLEVDAVIVCTGYQYFDFNMMPELEMDGANGPPPTTSGSLAEKKKNKPEAALSKGEKGEDQEELPHLPRLYHLIFPPRWADSVAFLSCFAPQEAVWNVCELASMAVAQVWAADTAKEHLNNPKEAETAPTPSPLPAGYRRPATLPSASEMDAQVNAYHRWWRGQWAQDHSTLPGFVQGNPFNRFLHAAAGTGLYENLDHVFALRNWWLWWNDRKLYTWLARGPINPCSYRLFDTNPLGIPGCGRRAWGGARKALRDLVSISLFPSYEDVEELKRDAAKEGGQ